EPLLSLRAETAEIAAPRGNHDVVEVRPERGHAALEVALEHGGQPGRRRRLAVVPERHVAEPELVRPGREGRLEQRESLEPRSDKVRPERRNAFAPRLNRIAVRGAHRDTAERSVPLRHSGAVLRGQWRTDRRETSENAIEVGAAGWGGPLQHSQPLGRADDGREQTTHL